MHLFILLVHIAHKLKNRFFVWADVTFYLFIYFFINANTQLFIYSFYFYPECPCLACLSILVTEHGPYLSLIWTPLMYFKVFATDSSSQHISLLLCFMFFFCFFFLGHVIVCEHAGFVLILVFA